MTRAEVPTYAAAALVADLTAHGVTLTPDGKFLGKPPAELLAELKTSRDDVLTYLRCGNADKTMLAWLKAIEPTDGWVTRDGKRGRIADVARKLVDGYLFCDRGKWWTSAGAFWLACNEGAWSADTD